jgi:sigma-B regulation protein RsbU (phosphoserine phosphatase)
VVDVDTDASRFEQLIPSWLFPVESAAGRVAVAVGIPLLVALPLLFAAHGEALRTGPPFVAALILVAALAGSRAVGIAGLILLLVYWRDGVPPPASFRIETNSDIVAVAGMALIALGLPLLTARIERTVQAVRELDAERVAVAAREREARVVAESLALQAAALTALLTALTAGRTPEEVAANALANLSYPEPPSDASIAVVRDGHLRILGSIGAPPQVIAALEQVVLDRHDWLRDVLEGHPALVEDRDEFARANPDAGVLRLYRSGSWAAIPFRYEETQGLLSMHWSERQQLVAHGDHLVLVAETIASALERARAQQQQVEHLAEIERAWAERDRIARTLSTTLLPPRLPRLDGFDVAGWLVPASQDEVAGDFYDLFSVRDGDWVAILGDVCGKGAEAAAVTSLARYAARATALDDPSPPAIADVANRALNEDSSDLFCTMGVARYSHERAAIDITLAGHPQGRIVGRDGVRRVGRHGAALGLFAADYGAERHQFGLGDTLVLFSDGLTERSREFDDDALDQALQSWTGCGATEIAERIRLLVLELRPDRRDDVAVLAISRRA